MSEREWREQADWGGEREEREGSGDTMTMSEAGGRGRKRAGHPAHIEREIFFSWDLPYKY